MNEYAPIESHKTIDWLNGEDVDGALIFLDVSIRRDSNRLDDFFLRFRERRESKKSIN